MPIKGMVKVMWQHFLSAVDVGCRKVQEFGDIYDIFVIYTFVAWTVTVLWLQVLQNFNYPV